MTEAVMHSTDPQQLLCCFLIAAFFGMAAFHAWIKRALLRSLGVRLRGLPLPWTLWLSSRKGQGAKSTAMAAEDSLVQRKIDELRVRSFGCGVELFTVCMGLSNVVYAITWFVIEDPALQGSVARGFVLMCTLYALGLWIQCGKAQPSLRQIKAFYAIVNGLGMLKVLTHPHMPHFLLLQNARTIFRAITGLIVLDSRISSMVNSLWALVHCHYYVYRHGGVATSSEIKIYVLAELATWICLQVLIWLAEFLADFCARLNLDILLARNVQQAVRRLLSVLCDAEVHLTPGLEIRDPSHKVAHLLAPDRGIAGAAAIEGRTFSDFVAESDQGRFRDFLARTAEAASVEALPAASIQVHLEDSTGYRFPVDLFHANLPDLEGTHQPDHLIGIRESGGAGTDAAVSAAPRAVPLPPAAAPGAAAAAAEQQPGEPQGVGGGAASSGAGQLDPGIFGQEFNASRPVDAASQASARSSCSMQTQVLEVAYPELWQTEIRFDAMSELKIREAHFVFKSKADAGPPRGMPRLGDWVHASMRAALAAWVRDNVNATSADVEPRCFAYGPLLMQWPSRGSGQQELVIRASKVAMDLAPPSHESSPGGPEHERPEAGGGRRPAKGCLAVLRLKGFKLIQFEEQPRTHRSRRERRDPGPSAGSLQDTGQGPNDGEAGDASSQASSRPSNPVQVQFTKVDLPEIRQVEIRFDAMAAGLEVADVRFLFKESEKMGSGQFERVPRLDEWVQESMRQQFLLWVQDNVHALCCDGDPVSLGPLTMRWPPRGPQGRREVLLKASKVRLDFEEPDEEDSQEGDCPAVLHLRGFQHLFVQHGLHHRPHRASSVRSHGSHRKVGRDVKKLPSISEPSQREEQKEVEEEEEDEEEDEDEEDEEGKQEKEQEKKEEETAEEKAEAEELDGREGGLRRRAAPEGREVHCDP